MSLAPPLAALLKKLAVLPGDRQIGTNPRRQPLLLRVLSLLKYALLAATAIQALNHFWGDPINCSYQSSYKDIQRDVLQSYCWMIGVHTLIQVPGTQSAVQPGVRQQRPWEFKDMHISHTYYQFIPLVLFALAVSCMIPSAAWSLLEGNKLARDGLLHLGQYINLSGDSKESTSEGRRKLAQRLVKERSHNRTLACGYFATHFLALTVICVQVCLLDSLFNGQYFGYGPAVLGLKPYMVNVEGTIYPQPDPMAVIFPKLVKCCYEQITESGQKVCIDAICTLSVNILNEKAFAILWFTYVAFVILSLLLLGYDLTLMAFARLRAITTAKFRLNHDADPHIVRNGLDGTGFGDWLLLDRIGQCLGPDDYYELLKDLANETPRVLKTCNL